MKSGATSSPRALYAVLLLDRAGWHTTGKLDMPANITPIFLPSRAPELNPVEERARAGHNDTPAGRSGRPPRGRAAPALAISRNASTPVAWHRTAEGSPLAFRTER